VTWESDIDLDCRDGMAELWAASGAIDAYYCYVDGGRTQIEVVILKDVDAFGSFDSSTSERRDEAEFVARQLRRAPRRGDRIIADHLTLTVQDLLEDDNIMVRVSVK